MEQTAMVNSAAGCDFWKMTSPSGSQASGETGRSSWMMGSSPRANSLERPSRKPSGVPSSSDSEYPLATSSSEYQVKRRIPWSSSPRLANGSATYGLLASQVLAGDGRLCAQVDDTTAHSPSSRANPASGSSTAAVRSLIVVLSIIAPAPQVLRLETSNDVA